MAVGLFWTNLPCRSSPSTTTGNRSIRYHRPRVHCPRSSAAGLSEIDTRQHYHANGSHTIDVIAFIQECEPPTINPSRDNVLQVETLNDLLALNDLNAVQDVVRRHPEVLQLRSSVIATRMLQLKQILPAANVPRLVHLDPTLLLNEDIPRQVGQAIRLLRESMPKMEVESQLHEGGDMWWAFVSCMEEVAMERGTLSSPPAPLQALSGIWPWGKNWGPLVVAGVVMWGAHVGGHIWVGLGLLAAWLVVAL